MTDVFISYSRKNKAFVHVLNQALADSKNDAWVDWVNIPITRNQCPGIRLVKKLRSQSRDYQ